MAATGQRLADTAEYADEILRRLTPTKPTGDIEKLIKEFAKVLDWMCLDEDVHIPYDCEMYDHAQDLRKETLPQLRVAVAALQADQLRGLVGELVENITEVDGWPSDCYADYDAQCNICGQTYRGREDFKIETPDIPWRPEDNLCTNPDCAAVKVRAALGSYDDGDNK